MEVALAAVAGAVVGFVAGRLSAVRSTAVEMSGRGAAPPSQAPRPSAPTRSESDAEIDALLRDGRKIEAIKVARERFGLGLKEAKDLADARERELRGS
jgi:large subunit ribosomal protein L7/L12